MLFPLDPNTPQCAVFEVLNNELLHFLHSSIHARVFDENLFSEYHFDGEDVRSVCWTNGPTREKFKSLWNELPAGIGDRQALYDLVFTGQDIVVYFDNLTVQLPVLQGRELFEAFKSLTTYLFTQTMKLSSARKQSNSTINHHYGAFKQANQNTSLCYICGTELLSQDRIGLSADDNWRADYDHILCKDKYPIYSVHPGNFVPTCHTCNSKAKGAKDALNDRRGRRKAFYPLPPSQESCYQSAMIVPHFLELDDFIGGDWESPLSASPVTFPNSPAAVSSKIHVWKELYEVPQRVEQHIVTNFCERIAGDLNLTSQDNFDDFSHQLQRAARSQPADMKRTEWKFWFYLLYCFLHNQDVEYKRDIWAMLRWKLGLSSQDDMDETFG
ncbi:hypothetical protein [Vibrio sp. 3-2(1)]|uniref:hypothetical protein n=1 Tax=Vibrio sp. 3-2(1) TaxID=2591016 RepID=UPI001482620D|nr:hypothetical protein [Vibrio sp. 3-2(1)]NNN70556.1 hypothetical protein [Vibrio sp. 3-2(1)]